MGYLRLISEPLSIHIENILSGRAEKQMIRITTKLYIAMVTDEQAVWDRPIDLFPG